MANNRAEIYFFNDYCINIVQTIFFSLGAEFVCYGRDRCWTLFGSAKGEGERRRKTFEHAGSIGTFRCYSIGIGVGSNRKQNCLHASACHS